MNKKTHKYVALLTMLAMVICTMFCTNTVKADTNLPWDKSEIAETSTCVVNGVERNLIILDDASVYLRIGESAPLLIYVGFNNVSAKFDQYGTIWVMDSCDDAIRWWNYDLSPTKRDFYAIDKPTAENPHAFVDDVESFILDENNKFIVGYKTFSDQTYPILTLDDMKAVLNGSSPTPPTPTTFPSSKPTTPTPTPSNVPTPTPTTPSPSPSAPVASPDNSTPSTIPTSNPSITSPNANSVTPTPAVTKKSVKKKAGYSCLSVGSKVTSKYKLTKGKLTWKGNGKSKKFSGIKAAGFIKKSGNLVFMTKQGKVYTLSSKGKKKCIVKKKAKKLIIKNKFVVKVKVGKKFINLANK